MGRLQMWQSKYDVMNLTKYRSAALAAGLIGILCFAAMQAQRPRLGANDPRRNRPRMSDTLKANIYADNSFMLWINGELVAVDSIAFVPHNAISVDILPEYPMTIAVMAKDFSDEKTGLEWNNTQIGDGGFVMKLGDSIVTNGEWKAKKVFWGPLDGNMQDPKVVRIAMPEGWNQPDFDDTEWGAAKVFTVQQVRPQQPYRDYDFEGAEFIWTEDLELDNTILFRYRVESPPSR